MTGIGELIQTADWKKEKHVPAIDCPDTVAAGEAFEVSATVGKEIAHPNTTEHHIAWIQLYFKPAGDKFAYEVGRYSFGAHGQSAAGPNLGPVHSDPEVTAKIKVGQAGTLHATSYCNLHGLWESSKEIAVG